MRSWNSTCPRQDFATSRIAWTRRSCSSSSRPERIARTSAIWNSAVSNPVDPLRNVRLENAARIWSAEDPVAALAASELLPAGALRDELRALIVEVWSRVDPGAAATWFSTSGSEDVELVEASLAALAERDVPRAWSLTGLLPTAQARNRSREAVLQAALIEDFDGAVAFFDTLADDGALPADFATNVLLGFGDRHGEALEWAMSRDEASGVQYTRSEDVTPDASGREHLMQWLTVFGGRRPTLAKNVIGDIADEASRDWAVAGYLALGRLFGPAGWPGRDTRADILWAESVASHEFLLQPEVTKILMRSDPDYAVDAMLGHDPGSARDGALTVAVARADSLAGERAERLLGSIGSTDVRRRAARQLYARRVQPRGWEDGTDMQEFRVLCRYEFDE